MSFDISTGLAVRIFQTNKESNKEEAQKKEEARAKENGVKSGHGERAEKKGRRNVREYTRESKRETIGMQVARYVVLGHA